MENKKIRVLIAKPGLDGHDRGAKVVAQALREAGMEIIYTGLHQTILGIVNQAIQEDVDVIGLSIMSGAHLHIANNLMQELKNHGIDDILVVIGGVIPSQDIPALQDLGIKGVFPNDSRFEDIVSFIQQEVAL